MPQRLRLAVSQSRTLPTLAQTLTSLAETARLAASQGVDLILFPEAYLGGYPRTCSFGAAIGSRTDEGREQFLQYFQAAVDLGDTPLGAGEDWVERRLPVAKGREYRGDGTREFLEKVARETGVFVVTGLVEKSGGTLYCSVLYVCPRLGVLGKRRKVMPTGSERLVWGQGSPSTLRAVTTTIRGVKLTMASAICWENIMPQLRWALYSQNVNLWLAPTADARPTWLPLMQTVGFEGRCFVLSAISCVRRRNLPTWVTNPYSNVSSQEPPAQGTVNPAPPLVNGTPSPRSGRRRSTYTTENRHELVLPTTEENPDPSSSSSAILDAEPLSRVSSAVSPMGRRRPTYTTENSHQLILPATNENASTAEPSSKPEPTLSSPNPSGNRDDDDDDDFVCRGGSTICGPMGQVLAGPLFEVEDGGLLIRDCDFEDCERGRLDLDVAGSYSRNDAFRLSVEGLDLNPPP